MKSAYRIVRYYFGISKVKHNIKSITFVTEIELQAELTLADSDCRVFLTHKNLDIRSIVYAGNLVIVPIDLWGTVDLYHEAMEICLKHGISADITTPGSFGRRFIQPRLLEGTCHFRESRKWNTFKGPVMIGRQTKIKNAVQIDMRQAYRSAMLQALPYSRPITTNTIRDSVKAALVECTVNSNNPMIEKYFSGIQILSLPLFRFCESSGASIDIKSALVFPVMHRRLEILDTMSERLAKIAYTVSWSCHYDSFTLGTTYKTDTNDYQDINYPNLWFRDTVIYAKNPNRPDISAHISGYVARRMLDTITQLENNGEPVGNCIVDSIWTSDNGAALLSATETESRPGYWHVTKRAKSYSGSITPIKYAWDHQTRGMI